jgi:hypothetical protein
VTTAARQTWQVVGAIVLSAALVSSIGASTNSLDTQKFSWDFRYYIGIAQNGLTAPLASPFAYRFATPLVVRALTGLLGVPLESGFRSVAYFGALAQLLSIFLLTRWLTGSVRGTYVALLVTAFSLCNVKFLLFDVFRPDHLAYASIILQTYLALERRFIPLLLATLIASSIREFTLIPLLAYLFAEVVAFRRSGPGGDASKLVREATISLVGIIVAIAGPRLLIPVVEDYQFVSLTKDGLLRAALAPFVLARDANFLFSIAAYALPILMLAGVRTIKEAFGQLSTSARSYLVGYTTLVLAFGFLGGTDFYRFVTYLFLPQAILIALVAPNARMWTVVIALGATVVFNRLWLPFPTADVGSYLDFVGGFGTRFDQATGLRAVEWAAWLVAGLGARRLTRSVTAVSPPSAP